MTPEEFKKAIMNCVWKHKRTGNRYVIQNTGKVQFGKMWLDAVIYSAEDGTWYCRESNDFYDAFEQEKTL